MRVHHAGFLALVTSLSVMSPACGSSSSGDTPDATTVEPPLEPAPPPGGQQLATSTWHLAPGAETYVCFEFYSPADAVGITRIDEIPAAGVHHLALFQAYGREEEPAPHECPTLIKTTWMPIWASGTGSPHLVLPTGTGFVIQPSTQYTVQLHLQNTTDDAIDVRAGLNLAYEHDTASLTPAGMYALGNYQVNIPAQTLDYQIPVDCQPNKDLHVFAAFPHMHKLGTKLEVTRNSAPFYKIDPWTFGNQPMDPMDVEVAPTDQLHMACHYDNHTDSPVTYGESSDDEMCFFVLFYYPYDALDGCIVGG